jgi:prevent-host-death family protein
MVRVPTIIPVSDLREDVADVLRRVRASRDPIVITQRGRAAAVMLSVDEYERAENERQLLRALARGEQEIRAGKGHDLDSVLAEADELLRDDDP